MKLRTKKPDAIDSQSFDIDVQVPTKGKKASKQPQAPTPSWRGVRKRGGGYAHLVEPPTEYRGTSSQVCGLWPWAAGGSAPTTGVPIGHHMLSKTTVCCDPISWFADAKLLSNPSAFLLGLPGLGKSSIVRRMEIGLAGAGVTPMTLGDTKPDHRDTTLQLGGQVVEIGRGRGSINVLDLGALDAAAQRLTGKAAHALREDAHGRRLNMVIALVALIRQAPVTDTEKAVLSAALRVLADKHSPDNPAVLTDLVALLDNPPDVVRTPTLDRGNSDVYRQVVDPLQRTVIALLEGPLGSVFAQPTTTRLALDAPAICVDVSSLNGHDQELEAAVLLATWAEGYGTIEAANALADAGLAPQRRFLVVLDELWRVLRGAPGMVDRIDALTRLNRAQGVGQIMITHTLSDLRALPLEEDRAKARGFVERAGMVIMGGLPAQELAEITEIVRLSEAEKNLVTSWSSPPSLSQSSEPPGRGNFLLKIGGRPGIPVHLDFTQAELDSGIHDTNQRWHEKVDAPAIPRPPGPAPVQLPLVTEAAVVEPESTTHQPRPVMEAPMPETPPSVSRTPSQDSGSQWAAALAELAQVEEPAVAENPAAVEISENTPAAVERPIPRPTLLENTMSALANLERLTAPKTQEVATEVAARGTEPSRASQLENTRSALANLERLTTPTIEVPAVAEVTEHVPDVEQSVDLGDPMDRSRNDRVEVQPPDEMTMTGIVTDSAVLIHDEPEDTDPLEGVFSNTSHLEPADPEPVAVVPESASDPVHEPVAAPTAPVAPRFTLEEALANPDLLERHVPAAAPAESDQTIDLTETSTSISGLLGLMDTPSHETAPDSVDDTDDAPVLVPAARTAPESAAMKRSAARRLRRKAAAEQPTAATSTKARSLSELMGGSLGDQS